MSDNTENKQPLGFFNIEENEDGINWGSKQLRNNKTYDIIQGQ